MASQPAARSSFLAGMGETTIIGIDPSSKKIAWVEASVEGWRYGEQVLPVKLTDKYTSYNAYAALEYMEHIFSTVLDPGSTDVYLEAPVLAGRGKANPQSMLPQAFVSGVIQAAAMRAGIRKVTMVAPSTWKKTVVGNGSAQKPQVGRNLRSRWPDLHRKVVLSGDLKDAGSICIYGCHQGGFRPLVADLGKVRRRRRNPR